MNALLSYLHDNRRRLRLGRYGLDGELAYTVLTPRFRASNHVIFLIFAQGEPVPALVAKVPRLAGRPVQLEQEAANLRILQTLHGEEWASAPALVAFEPFHDRAVLVETALAGQPMDPAFVRRQPHRCCAAVVDWLCEMQWPAVPSASPGALDDETRFARLVEAPYRYFADRFPLNREEEGLLSQSWTWLAQLQGMSLPSVFEHGDLSHPNLFLLQGGEVGVVDWETAEPDGMPGCDLFFFLTYVALSRQPSRRTETMTAAFRSAFLGSEGWALPYVTAYARRLQLPERALTPLFVLCWLRTLVSLLTRLEQDSGSAAPLPAATASWLRANRFYTFWQEAIKHASQLSWASDPAAPRRIAPSRPAAVR